MHIVYYGREGDKAKELAAKIREKNQSAQVRDATWFDGQAEPADLVTIMDCVTDRDADRIEDAYPDAEVSRGRPAKRKTPKAEKPKTDKPSVKIDKSEAPAKVDAVEAARRDVIEIPEDWIGQPFMTKRALARNIAGNNEPSIAAEVDAVIAAEVARREAR